MEGQFLLLYLSWQRTVEWANGASKWPLHEQNHTRCMIFFDSKHSPQTTYFPWSIVICSQVFDLHCFDDDYKYCVVLQTNWAMLAYFFRFFLCIMQHNLDKLCAWETFCFSTPQRPVWVVKIALLSLKNKKYNPAYIALDLRWHFKYYRNSDLFILNSLGTSH